MHHDLSSDERQDLLNELIHTYGNDILKIAHLYTDSRDSAEDAFQEVFIRVYKNLDRIEDVINIKGWLTRITINVCKDMTKSFWNKNIVLVDDYNEIERDSDELTVYDDENVNPDELYGIVWSTLKALPVKYKDVLVLHCVEELTSNEISKILNISHNTVRSRLRRARIAFRNVYERKMNKGG